MLTNTMTRADAAQLLGVDLNADPTEIASAWRAAVKKAHPDLGGTEEEFFAVSVAVEVLSTQAPAGNETTDEDGQDQAADEVPQLVPTVGARLALRIAWGYALCGTACAVAVVLIVLIVAPVGSAVAAPAAVVGAGYVAHVWWSAAGRPRLLPVWQGWQHLATWKTTTVRSLSDEIPRQRRSS